MLLKRGDYQRKLNNRTAILMPLIQQPFFYGNYFSQGITIYGKTYIVMEKVVLSLFVNNFI